MPTIMLVEDLRAGDLADLGERVMVEITGVSAAGPCGVSRRPHVRLGWGGGFTRSVMLPASAYVWASPALELFPEMHDES